MLCHMLHELYYLLGGVEDDIYQRHSLLAIVCGDIVLQAGHIATLPCIPYCTSSISSVMKVKACNAWNGHYVSP